MLTLAIGEESPKIRDDDRQRRAGMVRQQVVQENVYNDWTKKCECERDVAVDQQKRTACELKGAYEQDIVRLNEDRQKLACQPGRKRSRRNEFQEPV